jgi:hypothetical protein
LVVIGVHRRSSHSSTRSAASGGRPRARDRLFGHGRQRLRNLKRLRQPPLATLYLVDAHGSIDDHHVGEGHYVQSERAIQRLLGVERELVCVERLSSY